MTCRKHTRKAVSCAGEWLTRVRFFPKDESGTTLSPKAEQSEVARAVAVGPRKNGIT